MTNSALILGVTGMDGSTLADILLERGWAVHGVHRHTSTGNLARIEHILNHPQFTLHRGDLTDVGSLYQIVTTVKPQLLANEADQDNVSWSLNLPGLAARVTFAAVADLLEIVRQVVPQCRVFQPCSSTMFGDPTYYPQHEFTRFEPQSPYACAKVAVWHLCRMARQRYGMHVSNAILYNHTSPRQTEEYLLRKICTGAARIAAGQQDKLRLGNLDTRVDIGYAREYMECAVAMLAQDKPGDYVIASGVAWSIREMAACALRCAGVAGNPLDFVDRDPQFYRDDPGPVLLGDTSKARAVLGFAPQVGIEALIGMLVEDARGRI